jgi:hypothetical protein
MLSFQSLRILYLYRFILTSYFILFSSKFKFNLNLTSFTPTNQDPSYSQEPRATAVSIGTTAHRKLPANVQRPQPLYPRRGTMLRLQ